ncbi:MAG TPA: MBL fold metallo-hydrolase [Mycobacteriales bacterium]|nr:MBL fold metallo-hydrolase [Mycobacteriales bacterium]
MSSEYTGAVRVGGPADVRELPDLTITKIAVGPMDNNAYLLRCRSTGDLVLVDAANEPDRLLSEIGSGGLTRVVTTHQHFDHWQALAAVSAATGARLVAHPLDADALPSAVDELVTDGDRIAVGRCELEVIHLTGHTPGSIALLYNGPDRPHLITGDSLFPGGPGNTFGDADAFASLMTDLEDKVFARLPDETWVYPGHGADTTIGAERPSVPAWRARGW